MDDLGPGHQFGGLTIERELGRGSFARVWLARDALLGRKVALKVVRNRDGRLTPRARDAMLREARMVGRLKSAHIATLFRVHALPDDRGWAFEMECVEGPSLAELLGADRRLGPARVAALARGLLTALAEAHARDVVHGDVKPGNILFTDRGVPKLVDFGLARLANEASYSTSDTDRLVGTPAYMAPEVAMGERLRVAADLWGVGVTLYRCLAGRVPFPGTNLSTLFHAIQNSDPAPLDAADVPAHLAALTMHCLQKPPRDRPASCAAALEYLHAHPDAVREAPREPSPARARLYGRDRELAALHDAARDAARGRGRTAVLSAAAGMGKSALAREAVGRAVPLGFRWLEVAVSGLEGLVRPLLWAARDAAARAQDSPGGEPTVVRDLLADSADVRLESREQVLWAIERLLRGLAESGPVGVLVEHAQLANAEDVRLLHEIAARLRDERVFLLVLFRTRDLEASTVDLDRGTTDFLTADAVTNLSLEPLATDAVCFLLEEEAEGARIAPEIVGRILAIAEGNPFFARELFRHLRQGGAIEPSGGGLRPGPEFARATLPRRLRELASVRLEGLDDDERSLLDVAAVDGPEFDGEAAAALTGRPALEVLRAFQTIYRRTGIVVPGARGFRFESAIGQETIYGELAQVYREALHAGLAGFLEKRVAAGKSVHPARLGLHWERGGAPDRAAPHLLRAAHEAARRQELLRALDFAERAGLDLPAPDPATAVAHAPLLLDLAACYHELGRFEDAETLCNALLAGATDDRLRLDVQVRLALTRYRISGLDALDETELHGAARELPDGASKGRALYLLGRIAKFRGELESASVLLAAAGAIFLRLNSPGLQSSVLDEQGSLARRRGDWEEAARLYDEACRLSRRAGRTTNAVISDANGAIAAYNAGALAGLEQRLTRCIRTFAREGAVPAEAHCRVILSKVWYALGDRARAASEVTAAVAHLERVNHLPGLVDGITERAHLAAVAGELDAARRDLEAARHLVEKREDVENRLAVTRLACHVACFVADRATAAREAARAVDQARSAGAPQRAMLLVWLAEACIYGLPRPTAGIEDELVPPDGGGSAWTRSVYRGVCAAIDPDGGVDDVRAGAAALRGTSVGPRRETLRVLASLLEAEALRRSGDSAGALREAEDGLACAVALGHFWLEARLLRFLARLQGGEVYAGRLGDRGRELARGLADEAERWQLVQSWAGT